MIVKWGVIGCGDIAQRIGIPALQQASRSELVAVVSRDRGRARAIADRYRVKRFYTRVEDMLNDDDVNAVYVATPPALHCDQTRLSAAAGKHVLCEKPMAVNAPECAAMIKACAEHNVQLAIAYYRRFYPKVQMIKEILDQERIGRVVFARSQTTLYYNPLDPTDPKEWRATKTLGGGGCLIDAGSHRLDLLAHLLGDAMQVCAFARNTTGDYPVEDSAYLIAEFASGAHALANYNWNTEVRSDEFVIHGSLGKIVAGPLDSPELVVHASGKVEQYRLPRNELTHLPVVENFVRGINGEEALLIPGDAGIKASQMIDAAYEASRAGVAVDPQGVGHTTGAHSAVDLP